MTEAKTTKEEDAYLENMANKLAKKLFPFAGYHPMVGDGDSNAVIVHEAVKEVWHAARI